MAKIIKKKFQSSNICRFNHKKNFRTNICKLAKFLKGEIMLFSSLLHYNRKYNRKTLRINSKRNFLYTL